jgi:CHASE3 domain sensor protein
MAGMGELHHEVDEARDAAPPAGGDAVEESGGELLVHEARDEVVRLVTHPVAEIKRLEHVAEEGESAATPLVIAVGVTVFIAIVLAIVLTVVFLVYYSG